jgi:hypothetical protein
MEDIAPENAEAWGLFQRISCRFAAEFQTASAFLARVLDGMDGDDALDLLDRLSLIFDAVCPPKKP